MFRYLGWGISLLLATAALLSCTDSGTNPEPIPVLVPLAVGNEWAYVERYIYCKGTQYSEEFDTIRIVSDTVIGDETWYRFEGNPIFALVTSRCDGLWEWNPMTACTPCNKFHYPTDIGDQWSIGVELSFTIELVSEGAVVTVPAGTFVCGHYRMTADGYSFPYYFDLFFCPGAGLVKWDHHICNCETDTGLACTSRYWSLVSVSASSAIPYVQPCWPQGFDIR